MIYKSLKSKYQKEVTEWAYEDLLLTDLASMFEWTVEEIDTRFIELYLLMFGECAVWRLDGKLIVSVCNRAGSPNVNGLGKDLICITGNGKSKTFKNFEDSEEVVYIRNNKFATPDMNYERTASTLTELFLSLRCNIINSRYTPIIVCRDAIAKKSIEEALKNNNVGRVQVILSDNIFDAEKENVLNVTDVTAQDKIQYINHAYDDVMRQFWNIYGMNTAGASKQAQQTEAEINDGQNTKRILPLDRLAERKRGAEEIASKFGVSCAVDFGEAWRMEFEPPKSEPEEQTDEEQTDELATSQENIEEGGANENL